MYVDGEWLHTYWTKDPNRVVTVEELFNEMTAQILVRMPSVHDYVKDLFKGTSGEKIVTELPYLYAPEIKYVNGFMQIKVPWYITAVYIHEDIANALKLKSDSDWGRFKRIFERKLVEVPSTLTASITIRRPKIVTYEFEKERYFTHIPTKEIHEYILDNTRSSTTTRINTSNNIITITLPNTVEDTRVGIKGLPLLRITSWNKEQQYKQFLNPIYVPVRYTTISDLKVDIFTDSAPLKSNKHYISDVDMSGETKAFYMTLTPTVKAKTEEEYEQLMSDFETQLRKPIKLDSRMKWRVTMTNIFIPVDTRLVSKSDYNRHWFQYIWCKSSSHFKQKYYFLNSNEREDVTEFCREFNRNRIIGHEMSLCKAKVPLEFGITNSENLYMEFLEDVQKDSIVGVRMNKDILFNFLRR